MSLSQLSRLLPLPEDELQQILDYASTLSKPEAADHFANLLGDSAQAVSFISSFNSKRNDGRGDAKQPQTTTDQASSSQEQSSSVMEPVPKATKGPKKKKAPLHMPQPRRVENSYVGPGIVYNKKEQESDYVAAAKRPSPKPSPRPPAEAKIQTPPQATSNTQSKPQQGFLISDIPPKKSKSNVSSRAATPKPSNSGSKFSAPPGKVPLGGTSAAIADLDAAIREVEMTTNPALKTDVSARKCDCGGIRHPYQTAAPNCLACGKVICIKEGLGPCTNCGTRLLGSDETQAIISELKAERGRERMALDREANRRPVMNVEPEPMPVQGQGSSGGASSSDAEARARDLRDRLLGYQDQNARRTTINDEEASYDFSAAMGGPSNMWSSTEERAMELKRQQKLRREMEWNSRPEYEKRQQVVSIDLVGGKVVKKMAAKERPATPDNDNGSSNDVLVESSGNQGGGPYSRNPMGRGVMKPGFAFELKRDDGVESRVLPKWNSTRVQDLEGLALQKAVDIGAESSRSELVAETVVGDEPECG